MKVSGGPADALCAPPRTHAARLVLRVCGWDLGTDDRSLLATLICGELCFNTLSDHGAKFFPTMSFLTTRANESAITIGRRIINPKIYTSIIRLTNSMWSASGWICCFKDDKKINTFKYKVSWGLLLFPHIYIYIPSICNNYNMRSKKISFQLINIEIRETNSAENSTNISSNIEITVNIY